MKKLFALPLAAFAIAACSESTAPESVADLNPSYAKPVKPPSGGGVTPATTQVAFFQFNGEIEAQAGAGLGTDTDDGSIQGNASDLHFVPSNLSNGFVGRFNNTKTRIILTPTAAVSKYTVDFDLYVIGSWDGRGKQAQSGYFDANVFQVGYRCSGGAVTPIFTTTFSNQLTVQQDFPLTFLNGGNKAGTGAVKGSIDALGYADRPDLSHTPSFRSFGDATYHLTYTIANDCAGGVAPQFVFSSTAPGQQSNYDESWGIDNLKLFAN